MSINITVPGEAGPVDRDFGYGYSPGAVRYEPTCASVRASSTVYADTYLIGPSRYTWRALADGGNPALDDDTESTPVIALPDVTTGALVYEGSSITQLLPNGEVIAVSELRARGVDLVQHCGAIADGNITWDGVITGTDNTAAFNAGFAIARAAHAQILPPTGIFRICGELTEASNGLNFDGGSKYAYTDYVPTAGKISRAKGTTILFDPTYDDARGYALINEVFAKLNAHFVMIDGGATAADAPSTVVHGAADTAQVMSDVTYPAATNEATAIARINACRTAYEAHRVNVSGGVHGAADTHNAIVASAATTKAGAFKLAIHLKHFFNEHRQFTLTGSHVAYDTTNAVTARSPGKTLFPFAYQPGPDTDAPATPPDTLMLHIAVHDMTIIGNNAGVYGGPSDACVDITSPLADLFGGLVVSNFDAPFRFHGTPINNQYLKNTIISCGIAVDYTEGGTTDVWDQTYIGGCILGTAALLRGTVGVEFRDLRVEQTQCAIDVRAAADGTVGNCEVHGGYCENVPLADDGYGCAFRVGHGYANGVFTGPNLEVHGGRWTGRNGQKYGAFVDVDRGRIAVLGGSAYYFSSLVTRTTRTQYYAVNVHGLQHNQVDTEESLRSSGGVSASGRYALEGTWASGSASGNGVRQKSEIGHVACSALDAVTMNGARAFFGAEQLLALGPELALVAPKLSGTTHSLGDSTTVATWKDIGVAALDATQATEANRPAIVTQNGVQCASFDGISGANYDWMSGTFPEATNATQWSIMLGCTRPDTGAGVLFSAGDTLFLGYGVGAGGASAGQIWLVAGTNYINYDPSTTNLTRYLIVFDGALSAGSRLKIYRDFSPTAVATATGSADLGTVLTTYQLGRYSSGDPQRAAVKIEHMAHFSFAPQTRAQLLQMLAAQRAMCGA